MSKSTLLSDLRRTWLGLVISLLCLVAVFYVVDIEQLIAALKLANIPYIFVSAAFFSGSVLMRSFAWRTLLGEPLPISRLFFIIQEGLLLNNLLPFRLGEVGRAVLLSRSSSLSFWQVMSTIVVERLLDIVLVVSLLLITISFVVTEGWATTTAFLLGGGVLVGLVILYLMARNQALVLDWFTKLTSRIPRLEILLRRPLETFLAGLGVLKDGTRFARVIGWMIATWLMFLGMYHFALISILPDAQLAWSALGLTAGGLGVAIPAAPGGVGVVEAGVVAVLAVLGIERASALAYALILRLVNIMVTTTFGAFGLSRDGQSLMGIYQELRQRKETIDNEQ